MSKFFTNKGYLNMDEIFNSPEAFIFVLGARGIGKTYGATKWLIDNCSSEHKFIFMRRTKAEIDVINTGNIYAEHHADTEIMKESPFYKVAVPKGDDLEIIGTHMALSSISHIRGFSMLDTDYIYFDEFIPERGVAIRKHGGELMLNAYETINRNRELNGMPPVKCVFTSNYNTADSDIMQAFGYTDEIYKLEKARPIGTMTDGTKKLIMINDTKISDAKSETVLYKVAADKNYKEMALNNKGSQSPYPIANYNRNQIIHIGVFGGISFNKLIDGLGYFIYTVDKDAEMPRKYDLVQLAMVWNYGKMGLVYASDAYTANKFNNWFVKKTD